MSKADYQLLNNYMSILKDGFWDSEMEVRPTWEDYTPAHTVKTFGVVNRYNLQEEFPISGVRKLNWKAAIDEILWIWQLKSNNVKDLNSRIWDEWANKGEHPDQEIGSIGKAYGFQLGAKVIKQKDGSMIDQVDYVLHELKHNPANRRIMTEIFNHSQLHEMNLAPCVHQATFNVTNGTLNMVLNQRSNDTLAAGSWNVVQYAALLCMFAKSCGLKPGEMVHVVADSHVYDRHIPMELEIIFNRCSLIQKRLMQNNMEIYNKVKNSSTSQLLDEIYNIISAPQVDFDSASMRERIIQKRCDINYKYYLEEVKNTKTFNAANSLIKKMLNHPELDKALGFSTPKLVLDPSVDNFYNFKSPKMREDKTLTVKDGQLIRASKVVDNPNSSFDMQDYYPEIEGQELTCKVPVAK